MSLKPPRCKAATPAVSLHNAALAAEERRHEDRLAEIKRMRGRLAALDALVPALHEAGVSLRVDDIRDWGTRRIFIGNPAMDPARNAVIERVLREQGMAEESRTHYTVGGYAVDLKKGHLTVHISVDAHRIEPVEASKCA
ncbi:hypothetical protein [Paracidovorax citrulli]|uniref:hypothetical protein n=1 Tax=Paracidovorax citrulli TaxID=80869 RepID=UPI0005FAF058|nr:hypothetical protein [Paracidovorax citrulli]